MFHIHKQTHVQESKIELHVELEHIVAEKIQHDPDMKNYRVEVYKRMNSKSEEDFEANYEISDYNGDGHEASDAVVQNLVVSHTASQPVDVPPFIHSLDIDVIHAPEFSEYDSEFMIEMECNSRQLVVAAIRSYNISRGVDYITFYAKCKTYGRGYDCLIRISLI
ncbi:hypothetical protein Ahy_B08g094292 [Arachis hypogaea]|uniref:Transposase MuDR plant domain-containing protein n=1 Tax=Arachis hypogaea TaxID=3818 RepID=A0A444Y8F0_ARAHY|nr:hypothetical protein Ahy_B08g094292 [Arachis hypogaea]